MISQRHVSRDGVADWSHRFRFCSTVITHHRKPPRAANLLYGRIGEGDRPDNLKSSDLSPSAPGQDRGFFFRHDAPLYSPPVRYKRYTRCGRYTVARSRPDVLPAMAGADSAEPVNSF